MRLWDDKIVGSGCMILCTRFRGHNLINSPIKILRCFYWIPRGWEFM